MNSTLKNVLLAAGLATATLTGVRADDGPPPAPPADAGAPAPARNAAQERHGGMERRLQHLTAALDLTPAQQQQVAAVFAASDQQRQALMNESLSEDDRHAKMRALMTDTQARLRALLTPDQQKKLDAMPHPGRGRWGGRGRDGEAGPPAGGPPPAAPAPGTP